MNTQKLHFAFQISGSSNVKLNCGQNYKKGPGCLGWGLEGGFGGRGKQTKTVTWERVQDHASPSQMKHIQQQN